jgi:hypothetical protein
MSWRTDLPFSQIENAIFFALTHGVGELAPGGVGWELKGRVELICKVMEGVVDQGGHAGGGAFGHIGII